MESHPLDFLNPHEMTEQEVTEEVLVDDVWFDHYHEKYGNKTPATFDLFETLANAFKPQTK